MKRIGDFFGDFSVRVSLWITLCFSVVSSLYLAWVFRLSGLMRPGAVDALSMVAGYSLQAVGTGIVCLALRRGTGWTASLFRWTLGCFLLTASVAAFSDETVLCLVAGMMMNLLCGVIAGFYLDLPARTVPGQRQGKVFGFGYALSAVLVWLLSIPFGGTLTRGRPLIWVAAAMAVLAGWMARPLLAEGKTGEEPEDQQSTLSLKEGALAAGAVFLLSLVKNLGFSFPTENLLAGMPLELSRLFYAAGLILAGFLCDRSRKSGAVCSVAALALPFLMLTLSGQPVSAFACWSLDYLFYGVFSVFRVVLFWDLAGEKKQRWLAPAGLAAGRLGDAAGTGICLLLRGMPVLLVSVAMGLFMGTVFLFFRLYRWAYEPSAAHPRTEQEVFEEFAIHHDLSLRERDVLRLLLKEKTNAEIAQALFVTESTAKYHVHNLLQKSGCRNRVELLSAYRRQLYPGLRLVSEGAEAGLERVSRQPG